MALKFFLKAISFLTVPHPKTAASNFCASFLSIIYSLLVVLVMENILHELLDKMDQIGIILSSDWIEE